MQIGLIHLTVTQLGKQEAGGRSKFRREADRAQAQARNRAVEDGIIGDEARALGHCILLLYHLAYHR